MCFNDNSTFDIYRVSSRICTQANYMRQVGPVNRDELRELATAYKDGIPKPTKVNGTRWIDHKYKVKDLITIFVKKRATVYELCI